MEKDPVYKALLKVREVLADALDDPDLPPVLRAVYASLGREIAAVDDAYRAIRVGEIARGSKEETQDAVQVAETA